jgi:phosphate transport system substrate-binding protein
MAAFHRAEQTTGGILAAISGTARRCVLTSLVMLAVFADASNAPAEMLVMQGSTTFNRRLMERYQHAVEEAAGHELTVIPNKSALGLLALLEGHAHVAMISAPLENEVALLRQDRPGLAYDRLQAFEISRTRMAVAVHQSNPVRAAPLDTIRQILIGEIGNWRALGGQDLPIRIALVGGGGGVTVALEAQLLKGERVTAPDVIYVKSAVQLVQVVEQERGAIGFTQLALVKQRSLPELVTDEPIEQTLSLVTIGDPTPAMRDVIEAARRIAEKTM